MNPTDSIKKQDYKKHTLERCPMPPITMPLALGWEISRLAYKLQSVS